MAQQDQPNHGVDERELQSNQKTQPWSEIPEDDSSGPPGGQNFGERIEDGGDEPTDEQLAEASQSERAEDEEDDLST